MSITMGNDEFILYIRKNFRSCRIPNDQLGKTIWQWLQRNDITATKSPEDRACEWGNSDAITSETSLPKTAAQFRFSRATLPALYAYLDTIAAA